MAQRRHIFFSGNVQGVGFRYTTRHLAGGRAVRGFVRNLPDGRVELVVEGEPIEIDGFVAAIEDRFEGQISNLDATSAAATGEFDGFEIRR